MAKQAEKFLMASGKLQSLAYKYEIERNLRTKDYSGFQLLGLNDYNWWGTPKKDVLDDLRSEHYELMIDLSTRPMLPLRYIAMYTDADFKVGLNLGERVHDMLISLPDFTPEQGENVNIEASWLYDQIMSFITTIKSND